MVTSYGVGRYVASEADVILRGRFAKPTTSKRGIVWCHERGALANFLQVEPLLGAELLTRAGLPIIAADLGGTATWGNDTEQARTQQAWDYLVTAAGCASDKVLLYGMSMGAPGALNWARANPTKVAAVALVLPITDLIGFHDANLGGYATEIETAYGGLAAWNAAKAAHDPLTHAAEYAGIPIKLWYSTDDSLALPANVTAFAAASGASTQSMGAQGHTAQGLDAAQVLEFLGAYAG